MDSSILSIAASGIRAQQSRIDFVGHNLANAQTFGFRAVRPELVDLPASAAPYGGTGSSTIASADDPTIGVVDYLDARPDLAGPTQVTGLPLDVALPQGVYLTVQTGNGQTALTRDGHLTIGSDGSLQVGANRLASTIRVPKGSAGAYVDANGQIHAQGTAGDQVLGTLPLTRIPNPDQLAELGDGLAQPTANSGAPQPIVPSDLAGLTPQAVEGSNVEAGQELTHLMRAQRAYEANAQMVHTWDQLADQTIQNMSRS
jgi:flagellar basal-body rod protein FlgG